MSTKELQEVDLPKALLKRLIKAKLQETDKVHGGDGTRDFQINKDALLAFAEAGKLFIHYLTATANDICKDAKRQTISADDILAALTDLEFHEFIEPLKQSLDGEYVVHLSSLHKYMYFKLSLHRSRDLPLSLKHNVPNIFFTTAFKAENREKNRKKAEASKKRKSDAVGLAEDGNDVPEGEAQGEGTEAVATEETAQGEQEDVAAAKENPKEPDDQQAMEYVTTAD